jgi:hypothetical protein
MSDTPRTDAINTYIRTRNDYTKTDHEVWREHARTLETELAAANKRIADCEARAVANTVAAIIEKNAALRYAKNAEYWQSRAEKAEADTARLDWLDENMGYNGGGSGGTYTFFTPADVECGMLRDAIDAAMKDISK